MNTLKIVIDNLIVNYYRNEWNSNYIVLFFHWWTRNWLDWEIYFKELELQWISFISIDLPGFWYSSMPDSAWWIKEYSLLLIKFLEKIWNTKKIICVWHSFWWRICFYLWANYPALFSKIIAIAPWGVENIIPKRKSAIINIWKKNFSFPWLNVFWNLIRNKVWSSDYKNSWKIKKIFVKIVNEDLRGIFPNIQVPVIIYWWDKDDQILKWQIDIMEKNIPNVKINKYIDIGHDIHKFKISDILSDLVN